MNKKQVYILSLLVSLMVILMFMQQFFSEDIKMVAMRNNGVKNFSQYRLDEGKYKVLLPGEWTIEESKENIDDKELEVKFNSDKIEGSINILNNLNSIDEVDKEVFKDVKNKKYYVYNENEVLWNVIDYEAKESNNIRSKCYFREYSEGKVILINFKYDNSKYKPSMEVVFEEIVNNFR